MFLDTSRMRAGPFAEQLDRAIERCDVFVLLVSHASVDSTYVLRELHLAADDHDRPVLPVMLEDADVTPFRLLIAGLQRVPYQPGDPASTAAVVDGVHRLGIAGRRSRPSAGSRVARGVGGALATLGVLLVVGGMGWFFVLFAEAWGQSDPTQGPPDGFPLALGTAFAGVVVAGLGSAVRSVGRGRGGPRRR